ncbi:MAG: hypothetical protein KA059_06550 [Elusimicrobiales bacterium]|jgi:hypothetical protein|nr:hypothetical protein [Elusimicrobiales bacterium]NLH38552.1 hypothetical protein [Elusimicrobiota bacterium]
MKEVFRKIKKLKNLSFLFFIVFFVTSADLKTTKKGTNTQNTIEKRLSYLEKKIISLEKRIKALEKTGSASEKTSLEEIRLSLISSQILKGATKEGIKFDISVENRTSYSISFIFGRIELIDADSGGILYFDNFYFDEMLKSHSKKETVIVVESSNPSFNALVNAQNIRIKFTPIKVLKQGTKDA